MEHFAQDWGALNDTFIEVFYKMTTIDMGPVTRCLGPWVPPVQSFQDPLPEPSAAAKQTSDYEPVKEVIREVGEPGR